MIYEVWQAGTRGWVLERNRTFKWRWRARLCARAIAHSYPRGSVYRRTRITAIEPESETDRPQTAHGHL